MKWFDYPHISIILTEVSLCPWSIYPLLSSHQRRFMKKRGLLKFCKIRRKTPVPVSEKETQIFPWEFCEISKNIFFTEHLWTTASIYFNLKSKYFLKTSLVKCQQCLSHFTSVAFHIETCHLICTANRIAGFYMECNTGPNQIYVGIAC